MKTVASVRKGYGDGNVPLLLMLGVHRVAELVRMAVDASAAAGSAEDEMPAEPTTLDMVLLGIVRIDEMVGRVASDSSPSGRPTPGNEIDRLLR